MNILSPDCNRPFLSSKNSDFQKEAKWKTFHLSYICMKEEDQEGSGKGTYGTPLTG